MQRMRPDRKSIAVIILVIALGGLGFIQYRMLGAYYSLSRAKMDQQISMTLAETGDENYDRTLLSNLISAIITEDTLAFPVSLDSLRNAGTQFYRMYLTDRFARANLPTSFEFAITDQITRETYLATENYSSGIQWVGNYKLPLAGVIQRDCGCAPFLNVRFSRMEAVLFRGIEPVLVPAIACFLLLIVGFYLLLRILREQKYLDRVKTDFINNLTHELKTPVFSISLATRIMREKNDGSMNKYLDRVEKDIDQLKGNVEKVLELASIENRKNLLDAEKLNARDFLEEWKSEQDNEGMIQLVEWESDLPENAFIKADAAHLRNALNNLLDNAFKYGGEEQKVKVISRVENDEVLFSVTDKGPGIDKSEHEAIFGKFYRVQNGHAAARGYGLGLSYVRQVIKMMNGTVAVTSAPHEGSTFMIKLPCLK